MSSSAENLYAVWREKHHDTEFLRDKNPVPPEKLLQAVWQHQRLQRDRLKTAAGKSVRILHPGFISVEGGPDFRGAVLQFGEEPPVVGDVEVDLHTSGWHAHGHDTNPAFKNVILHVVWHDGGTPVSAPLPVLSLQARLDSTLAELALALENESQLPGKFRGKCSAPLGELTEPQLTQLLQAAANTRFQNKAGAMLARAKQSGWEATLWENLFRALGYKHNAWPMQKLAEQRARLLESKPTDLAPNRPKPELLQVRLFGVSGLLPDELTRRQKCSDTFLRHAWDLWWRERDGFADCLLPRATWKFHGLRPTNHPQRRLALAAHWLADEKLISNIEHWLTDENAAARSARELLSSFQKIFQVEHDSFWSWHWTFRSVRMRQPQPLLGEARATDLAVNVVLPWLWVRAKEGGNQQLQREVERRFFAWPPAEDNSVLKQARQRLLGATSVKVLKSAAAQQGLMQVVRDFCEHSNAICSDCRFPELVRGFKVILKDDEERVPDNIRPAEVISKLNQSAKSGCQARII